MQHAIDVLNTRLGTLDCHETLSSSSVEVEKIEAQKDSLALAILELELLELKKQVEEHEGKIESQKRRCAISKSRAELAEEGYKFISRDEPPEEGDEVSNYPGAPWKPTTHRIDFFNAYLIRRKIS